MRTTATKPGMVRRALPLLLCSFFGVSLHAQQTDDAILSIERNKADNTPTSITFRQNAQPKDDHPVEILGKYLGVTDPDMTWVQAYRTTNKSNVTTARYNEYCKGIKIEYASYALASKNGYVTFMTGNYYPADPAAVSTPTLSEGDAFTLALQHMGAEKYMWEDPQEENRIKARYHKDTTFKPHGILTWIEDLSHGVPGDRKLHLAYAFDIYASKPLNREVVYIDAATGKVLYANPMIKHTAASGHTKYSGVIPFQTAHVGATYELFDSTRGTGVHTLNMHNGSSYGASTEYTSASNTWPVAAPDTVALDAHWGAEIVYDYWKTQQGRLSYDNADGELDQYVHYQTNYNNAFWDGAEMTYGDGSGCSSGFTPLVSLDVTAHEIGHGVCQYTCNLVYAGESGGIDEGFSDCWGATIENWGNPHEVDAVPKVTWSMGEEIGCGNPLRRLDFPKLKGLPDTYLGINWYTVTGCVPSGGNDQCGVHTNMGVISKWYYLLTVGGSGTNDNANTYSVTGIGFAESSNILYQTELVLASTADYPLLRTTAISTATTLYGACSPEVVAVTNAWYAVGVGAAYVAYPAFISGANNVCVGSTISLSDATPSGTWTSSFPAIATVDPAGNVTGSTPGVDTIIYSIGAGCDAKQLVTVNALPPATISPAPTAVLCAGSTSTLTADAGTGYTYQWKLAGSPIGGATNVTYNTSSPGSFTVVVTDANGCSAASSATIVSTVALPSATITPLSSTTFCTGGSVTLNANPGVGYTYQWQVGGVPILGATGISYTASAGGNYSVIVTNSSGCSQTSASTTVTVNPPPSAITGTASVCSGLTTTLNSTPVGGTWASSDITTATVALVSGAGVVTGHGTGGTATITYTLATGCYTTVVVTVNANIAAPIAGSSSVCFGQTVFLTDATIGGTWSSVDPSVASVNSTSGAVTGASVGTTTISYVVTTLCGVATVTAPMVVNPVPTVAAISGATTVCNGGSIALTDATPGGVWSSSDITKATVGSSSGVVTGVSVGSAAIYYTVTNTFGCNTSVLSSVSIFEPFVAAITPAGPTTFCTGDNVVLNASTGPGYHYQWNNYGTPIAGATSASYTASTTGSYTVLIYLASGCRDLSSFQPVDVNPLPVVAPSVTVTASPGFTMCIAPAPVTFTAVPAYGGPSPAYQWFVNGTSVGTGGTYGYTPAAGDVVTCQLTSDYVCATPLVATRSYTVTLQPTLLTPSVSVLPNISPVCTGDTIIFAATPVNGGPAPTFLWTQNGVNVATGPHYHYVPANGDHLVVTMTSDAPCVSPSVVSSSTFTVAVQNHVTNSVTISVSESSIAAGSVDTFTAIAMNGGASPSFQWLKNGVIIAGATSARYVTSTLANGDVISCMETSSAACADPGTVISGGIRVVVNPVGVVQLTNADAITLLPNPSKGAFTIEGNLNNLFTGDVNITVTDMLGQVVYSRVSSVQNGQLHEKVSFDRSVANGVYFVTLNAGATHLVFHMVVDK